MPQLPIWPKIKGFFFNFHLNNFSLLAVPYHAARFEKKSLEINKEEKQYKCSTCRKVFGSRQLLFRHKLSCKKPGSHKCDGCNVRFNRKIWLLVTNQKLAKVQIIKTVVYVVKNLFN